MIYRVGDRVKFADQSYKGYATIYSAKDDDIIVLKDLNLIGRRKLILSFYYIELKSIQRKIK